MVWLLKPGKDPGEVGSWRDLHLIDNLYKAASNIAVNTLSPGLINEVSPTEYGFVPGRGTTMATAHVEILAARLKKAGKNFACCFFDKAKAYQSTDLEGLVESSCNRFKYRDLSVMITVRHSHIFFLVQDRAKNRYMVRASQGIITGDAYGPMAFVLHAHDWLENLWATQDDYRSQGGRAAFPKAVASPLTLEQGPPQRSGLDTHR